MPHRNAAPITAVFTGTSLLKRDPPAHEEIKTFHRCRRCGNTVELYIHAKVLCVKCGLKMRPQV
jgi:ribosomal protein L37E